jgi:hypothetical protein
MTASGLTTSTFSPDQLIAGNPGLLQTRSITLLTGENRTRGALLGKQTTSTVPATGTAGTNTGNGTMGSVAVGGTKLQAGTYTVRIVKAATNAGDFVLIAPDGSLVGYGTVAVAFTSTHLNFTVADGATDFAVGDTFTVAVTGSGKFKLSTATATDGSQNPVAVLAEATDASAADKVCNAYFAGEFDENELTLGSGHTVASVKDALHKLGIRLMPSISA